MFLPDSGMSWVKSGGESQGFKFSQGPASCSIHTTTHGKILSVCTASLTSTPLRWRELR